MSLKNTHKHLLHIATDFLTYNRTEQRGILVLCLILLCVGIANTVIPSGTFRKSPDFRAFEMQVIAFESAWQKAADSDSIARTRNYRSFKNNYGKTLWDSSGMKGKPSAPPVMIELNSADTLDLQQLRGIGPGFARRIVQYRERLHGYCDKKQVLEVFGMDTGRYQLIERNLAVNRDSIRPFDLNAVTFKELLRHPYFPFPVTKNIMIYRQKNKMFRSLDELRRVDGITDSLFSRMIIYLRLGP
jgi:DNA uptake protein ComE-like DNA-binding protein